MKAKPTRLSLLALITVFFGAFGCGSDDNNDSPARSTVNEQKTEDARRIIQLKNDIRQSVADNPSVTRETLDPMVQELEQIFSEKTVKVAEVRELLLGAWHQLWSDLRVGGKNIAAGSGMYEVILSQSTLWHLVDKLALRAEFGISEDGKDLSFTYTKGVEMTGALAEGDDLRLVADQAEAGTFDASPIGFKDGETPVGKKSSIHHIFIDEDMRLAYGPIVDGVTTLIIFNKVSKVGEVVPVAEVPPARTPRENTGEDDDEGFLEPLPPVFPAPTAR